jgi:hypothetical protein
MLTAFTWVITGLMFTGAACYVAVCVLADRAGEAEWRGVDAAWAASTGPLPAILAEQATWPRLPGARRR